MSDKLQHLLTPTDVSQWLSVPTAQVLKMAKRKDMPSIVLPNGKIVFDTDELRQWLESLRSTQQAAQEVKR